MDVEPPVIKPSPKCYFPDKTEFGSCSGTTLDMVKKEARAVCRPRAEFCSSIATDRECASTPGCKWSPSGCKVMLCSDIKDEVKCVEAECKWDKNVRPAACVQKDSPQAAVQMPVCLDNAPQSCINKRCMAMMCGYSGSKFSPPPSSSDWDAQKSKECGEKSNRNDCLALEKCVWKGDACTLPTISQKEGDESAIAAGNLLGTACRFETMDRALYNRVRASKGKLWVNSFRFGVGRSFSDFEQARNFFPISDRLCAANPIGTIDRFVVYYNLPQTYCKSQQGYYQCKGEGQKFSENGECKKFCENRDCQYSSGEVRVCGSDKTAYDSYSECSSRCPIIDGSKSCYENSNDAPFLFENRFKMKYVADFLWDTNSKTSDWETCHMRSGPNGNDENQDFEEDWGDCGDFYPQGREEIDERESSDGAVDGVWRWWYPEPTRPQDLNSWRKAKTSNGENYYYGDPHPKESEGSLRAFFENHKQGTIDFDYEWYAKNLLAQYASNPDALDGKLPFECSSSVDCISGACSIKNPYSRSVCKADPESTQGKRFLSCGAYSDGFGSGRVIKTTDGKMIFYSPDGTYGEATALSLVSPDLFGNDGRNPNNPQEAGHLYTYYVADAENPKLQLFEKCGITGEDIQTKCIAIRRDGKAYIFNVPTPPAPCKENSPQDCRYNTAVGQIEICNYYQLKVRKYEINFENAQQTQDGKYRMGYCLLEDKTKRPYFDILNLGWCEGCTHLTLAKQKITWGNKNWVRPLLCYSWHGEFNYDFVKRNWGEWRDWLSYNNGQNKYQDPFQQNYYMSEGNRDMRTIRDMDGDGREDASASYVRKGGGDIFNGPLEMMRMGKPDFWGIFGDKVDYYVCDDGWNAYGDWWRRDRVPNPSAPYLNRKLTSYLKSNIMPVLDVKEAVAEPEERWTTASASCEEIKEPKAYICIKKGVMQKEAYQDVTTCNKKCDPQEGGLCLAVPTIYKCSRPIGYYQTADACKENCENSCEEIDNYERCSSDGKIYALGYCSVGSNCKNKEGLDTFETYYKATDICRLLDAEGSIIYAVGELRRFNDDEGAIARRGFLEREVGLSGYLTNGEGISEEKYTTKHWQQVIVRAILLKQRCRTPPLVGLDIGDGDNPSSLLYVGTPTNIFDENDAGRGTLHKFFYSSKWDGSRVALSGPMLYSWRVKNAKPDKYPDQVDLLLQTWKPKCQQGVKWEISKRLNFSRALMANFSKPSLIWSFYMPSDTQCYEMKNGLADYSYFFSELFNSTAEFVDAGIIGIIYDSWMTQNGLGYGKEEMNVLDWSERGKEKERIYTVYTGLEESIAEGALDAPSSPSGKTAFFCPLQRESKKVMGLAKYTYGQKVYATDVGECTCVECTDNDYAMGLCDTNAQGNTQDIPQQYCNDGKPCEMPAGRTDYQNFKCPANCMRESECEECKSIQSQSVCRIREAGGKPQVYSKPYSQISDEYWEFLAGLPTKDKCCLLEPFPNNPSKKREYTYVSRLAEKQRSEFLQFPRRGERELDCGRTVDTSVLKYCGVKIPISQVEVTCFRN